MDLQHKSLPLEIKKLDERQFEGYGAVFGNRDLGGDIVVRGAFARSIAEHRKAGTQPLMFWMHQPDQVPGVWLDVSEDKDGLRVVGEVVDTTLGRDVHTLLQKRAVRGLSIGYRTVKSDWDREGNRILQQLELHEVSIVSMAMNPMAQIEAVKARLSADGEYIPTEREMEHYFRTLGCSKGVARTLTARVFGGADPGGMLGAGGWDAHESDDESEQVKQLLESLGDSFASRALLDRMQFL